MLEAEQELILERTWQLAGHVSQLTEVGSYLTTQAGTQPVLVVRDKEMGLRAFRNVCRHRGSRLLSGSGRCGKAIRCRYHGWTYRFDGSLIGMPEVRSFGEVEKSTLGLLPARVEELCGLVFVNLDPHAVPLAEQVGDLPARMERYRIEELVPHEPAEDYQDANWKLVAENYLEGYHIPIGHPGLMRMLDYRNYDVQDHGGYVWIEGPMREEPSGTRLERAYRHLIKPMPGLRDEDVRAWRYIYIYPNTAIDLYPDQVATWQIRPAGVQRTHDVFMTYRERRPAVRTRIVQRINNHVNNLVQAEDVDLVANVQAGLETRGFTPGPLSARENAIAWFADRVRADLGPAAAAEEARLTPEPDTAVAATA